MARKGRLPRSFGSSLYPDITDEIRCAGKEPSSRYFSELHEYLNASRLGRVSILKAMISMRKHGWRRPQPVTL